VIIILFSFTLTLFRDDFVSSTKATATAFSIGIIDCNSLRRRGSIGTTSTGSSSIRATTTADSGTQEIDIHMTVEENTIPSKNRKMKQIFGVRHGLSVANEYMAQPGNRWGEETFYDNITLKDAMLSRTGIDQARQLSQKLLLYYETIQKNQSKKQFQQNSSLFSPSEIDLVIISPLSRCIQTWEYGILPVFNDYVGQQKTNSSIETNTVMPKVLCLPILRERVYTASDTGRPLTELQKEFNTISIDWDESIRIHTNGYGLCNKNNKKHGEIIQDIDDTVYEEKYTNDNWWYNPTNDVTHDVSQDEWRPYGNGQYYAVPGEPQHVFQKRMKQLQHFLQNRKEQTILLVTHWGVLLHFTSTEVDNCSCIRISV
jgi:broad specificity phosphatase PhoE